METTSPNSAPPANSNRRWLCAISAIIGLALSMVLAWQWYQTRNELKQVRNELGELLVADESRLHVVEIPTVGRYTWRWRLHVPEGDWVIKSGCGSGAEVIIARDSNRLPPGQYTVETRLHADELRQVWLSTVAKPGYHQMAHRVPPEMQFSKWILEYATGKESDNNSPVGLFTLAIAGNDGQVDWPVHRRVPYPLVEIVSLPIQDKSPLPSGVESLKVWIEQTE